MKFYPFKPFEIRRQSNKLVDNGNESLALFWEEVEAESNLEGLSEAIGIYIFSIRAGRGNLPWYVGKAEKQVFKKECFQHHKLTHYNNCIAGRPGTPLLTLIPKYTQNGYFAKPNGQNHSDISALEKMLIGTCLQKNQNLVNIKDTKIHKELVLPGYINTLPGGLAYDVKEFKSLLGI